MKLSLLLISFFFTSNIINASVKDAPKHVIMIGFDGLSGYGIEQGAKMPTLRKLMSKGAYTLEARTVFPSISAVNWASIFMGAGPELHGYMTNNGKMIDGKCSPDLPSRVITENGMFPDIYYQIRKHKPDSELGFIYKWWRMPHLVDTLSINHVSLEALTENDITKKINIEEYVAPAVEYIKTKKPTFCSFIFSQPDAVGHGSGWHTKEYYSVLESIDKALFYIVKAISDAGIEEETVIIITSDHGGINRTHGGIDMKEVKIPIVYCGKGIKKGFEIKESVMIYDFAATVAYLLDIPIPQVWIARPTTSIFE